MPPRIQQEKKSLKPFITLGLIFLGIVFLGMIFVSCLSIGSSKNFALDGNVALINIEGEIVSDNGGGFLASSGASSTDIVSFIREADQNPQVKAILLRINSPGGAPVASEEIAASVNNASKPIVALIRDQGTSGAYWVASAADGIVASPISIVGSIGVLGSSLEFSGFMQKYGIGYEKLIAGQYKDIGIPFRNLTLEERAILQQRLDLMHQYFIKSVAENRGMGYEKLAPLANGLFYTGEQGLELGLVDRLGGVDAANEMLKEKAGLDHVTYIEYSKPQGFFEALTSASSNFGFSIGQGFGQRVLSDQFKIRT